MRVKRRKVLNGMAVSQFGWSACQYKIRKASGWVGIERDSNAMTFTVCIKDEEANVHVPNTNMSLELYMEAGRLLAFSESTKDKVGRSRVTVVSKLLRHLRRARYGDATEFGVLLRKLFEKTNLEDV